MRNILTKSKNKFTVDSVRRELFKLGYSTGDFDLNQKGDASEALLKILSLLHSSMLSHRKPNDSSG